MAFVSSLSLNTTVKPNISSNKCLRTTEFLMTPANLRATFLQRGQLQATKIQNVHASVPTQEDIDLPPQSKDQIPEPIVDMNHDPDMSEPEMIDDHELENEEPMPVDNHYEQRDNNYSSEGGRRYQNDRYGRDAQKQDREPEEAKLFVGNLAWATEDQALYAAFETYGSIIEAKVVRDKFTDRSRGFGFISFESAADAQSALTAMDGVEIDGRAVRVDRANKRVNYQNRQQRY